MPQVPQKRSPAGTPEPQPAQMIVDMFVGRGTGYQYRNAGRCAEGRRIIAPADGEALVRLMRARYSGIWYKTSAEPGLLRIDQGNPAEGNGVTTLVFDVTKWTTARHWARP